jgi:hypothetical protein
VNQTSPAATGTAGVAITALVAVISALNNRFGLNLPAQDQVAIAGGIVVGAHWLAQQYAGRAAAKHPAS